MTLNPTWPRMLIDVGMASEQRHHTHYVATYPMVKQYLSDDNRLQCRKSVTTQWYQSKHVSYAKFCESKLAPGNLC